MSFQSAGDASEAWQVTFPVEGSDPVVLDVAVIRRGSVWLMVGVTDFGYVDPGDFESLVRGTLSKFPVDA
jgi:hypothetical protein